MNEDIVSLTLLKMLRLSKENFSDINHFLKVLSYATLIAGGENVDEHTLFIIKTSSIVHDISCPGLRKRYGRCDGEMQEKESHALLESFFSDIPIEDEDRNRVIELVSHHHSPLLDIGIDHRILLEADALVNAEEKGLTGDKLGRLGEDTFRTETGKNIFNTLYEERISL